MWWYVVLMAIIILSDNLSDILKELRSKSPKYQKDLKEKDKLELLKKQEIFNLLQNSINKQIIVSGDKLFQIGKSNLKGELKSMDQDWLELYIADKNNTVYLKIEDIVDVSLVI